MLNRQNKELFSYTTTNATPIGANSLAQTFTDKSAIQSHSKQLPSRPHLGETGGIQAKLQNFAPDKNNNLQ